MKENEHTKHLQTVLDKLREHRRALAENMAGDDSETVSSHDLNELMSRQQKIECVKAMLEDERSTIPTAAYVRTRKL